MISTLVATPDPEPRRTRGEYPQNLRTEDRETMWRDGLREMFEIIAAVESGRMEAVWR